MKINWKLLETHKIDYSGNCVYCGTHVNNCNVAEERYKNQRLIDKQFTNALNNHDVKKVNYLRNRIKNTVTYHFNN